MEFVKDSVGRVIRSYRLRRGLSQEIMSGLIGIPRSHLAAIELGTKQPNFQTIWRIADALNVEASELVKSIEEDAAKYQGDK